MVTTVRRLAVVTIAIGLFTAGSAGTARTVDTSVAVHADAAYAIPATVAVVQPLCDIDWCPK